MKCWIQSMAMVCAVLPAIDAEATVITITNPGPGIMTLSDLYAFSKEKNQGDKTEILKKGDATDDVNIAAGGQKNYDVGNAKSMTVSWMVDGKEVENDVPAKDYKLALAAVDGFDGLYAVDFAEIGGRLPPIGYASVIFNGKFANPAFGWITLYDTTASDGFIMRDADGNPISPRLNGVRAPVVSHYNIRFNE